MDKTAQATNNPSALIALICIVAIAPPLALAHPHDDAESPPHQHDSDWQGNHLVHENGIGADPDGDTNPATDTRVVSFLADAETADGDPPYTVITFEPPPGEHGETIRQDYATKFGVQFGKGLTWQICTGTRLFYYDTMCTYEAPTSGKYSAGYLNYLNAPLSITFEKPVCVVTMSIYPTGGKEDEPFEFKIQGWNKAGDKLSAATAEFRWTASTVRWRNMAGAYFVDQRAAHITISMRSKDPTQAKDTLRYLIDDFAFVDDGCDAALDDIKARTGIDLRDKAGEASEEESPANVDADTNGLVKASDAERF